MAKIYYLPRPYPDELIGSVLIRAARQRGQSLKQFAHQLTGTRTSHWPLFLSAHLAKLGVSMSVSPRELLYRHTVFPYSTARMGRNETERLANNTIELNGKSLTVLVQSAAIGKAPPRYCPICIIDDIGLYGESYWHRKHNLPFIQRCSTHGTTLHVLSKKVSSKAISVYSLPEECSGEAINELLAEPTCSYLMQLSINCLDERNRKATLEWLRDYRRLAESRGFPRQGAGLSNSSLQVALKAFYGEEFFRAVGLNFDPLSSTAWPVLLLRCGYEISVSTPRHLLLQAFLQNTNSPPAFPAKPPGRKPRNLAVVDEQVSLKLSKVLNKLPIGTRLTVSELLSQVGAWATFRHNREAMPMTRKAVLDFLTSDHSARQSGRRPYWRKRLGLSQ